MGAHRVVQRHHRHPAAVRFHVPRGGAGLASARGGLRVELVRRGGSNTLDTEFCVAALDEALTNYGRPDIFNTDQGAQFTSHEFTSRLLEEQIAISMDGRGRALDNVFIERLWRSVKYEDIYLKDYESGAGLSYGLDMIARGTADDRPAASSTADAVSGRALVGHPGAVLQILFHIEPHSQNQK